MTFANCDNTPAFRDMMRFEVARAREWFAQGLPLVAKVDRKLAIDIDLFSRGGMEILKAIERQGYAVLGRRSEISKARKLALVARAALRLRKDGEYDEHGGGKCASTVCADPVAAQHGVLGVP